jgi:hypothetical protein
MEPDEKVAKHVEQVQLVVNRMAANGFILKGWSVTVVVGLLAFAVEHRIWFGAIVGLLPALSFWWLDAYYLRQERLFRKLHDYVRRGGLQDNIYSMDTSAFSKFVPSVVLTMFSMSVVLIHGLVVIGVFLTAAIVASHQPS